MPLHRHLVRAAAAPVLLLAAACGSTTPADDGGVPTPDADGPLSVQVSGGDSEIAAIRRMAEAFTEASGREVELVPVPSQGDHIAKLTAAFAAQDPPDVFLLNYRRFGQFAERGVVVPPDGLDTSGYYEPAIDAFTVDGELQCVPQNASSSVLYVNPALFAKAGVPLPSPDWTFDDALQTTRALASKGVEAVGFDPLTRTVSSFVWAAGGEVVDDSEEPTRTQYDTPEGRRALGFLLELQKTGVDATERAAEEPEARFTRGQVALFYDSRRAVPGLRKAGLDFDVLPLPRDAEAATLLASDAYCVSKGSDKQGAAAEFVRFATGAEGGTVLAETGRTVPSMTALAESDVFLAPDDKPASAQVFLDNLEIVRALPNVAGQDEAEEAADEVLEQVFAGRIPLDEGAAQADEASAAVYAQRR